MGIRHANWFDWSDETALATLKRMHAEGASASQIAKALGGGVSRNSVIGKIHRLGLARSDGRRKATMALANVAKRAAAPRRLGIAGNGMVYEQAPAAKARSFASPSASVGTGEPARIIDAHFGGCRWPINAPSVGRGEETLFCCGPRDHGDTYCRQHKALAYSKANNPLGKKAAKTNDMIRQLRRYA